MYREGITTSLDHFSWWYIASFIERYYDFSIQNISICSFAVSFLINSISHIAQQFDKGVFVKFVFITHGCISNAVFISLCMLLLEPEVISFRNDHNQFRCSEATWDSPAFRLLKTSCSFIFKLHTSFNHPSLNRGWWFCWLWRVFPSFCYFQFAYWC